MIKRLVRERVTKNLGTIISGHTMKFFRNNRTCFFGWCQVRFSLGCFCFCFCFTIPRYIQLSLQLEYLVFLRGIASFGEFGRLAKIVLP